jgi:hypothetical protein
LGQVEDRRKEDVLSLEESARSDSALLGPTLVAGLFELACRAAKPLDLVGAVSRNVRSELREV